MLPFNDPGNCYCRCCHSFAAARLLRRASLAQRLLFAV
jgi:hypothetical protein